MYQLLAIRFIFLLLFYVCDCFASVHVCVLHECLFEQRPEEGIRSPGPGDALCVLGIKPRSSIEQQVLITTAEPCFQPWLLEGFLFLLRSDRDYFCFGKSSGPRRRKVLVAEHHSVSTGQAKLERGLIAPPPSHRGLAS